MKTTLVHEATSAGQHRIVVLRDGIPKASPWFEHHQIAVHGKYRATLTGGNLPQGIFTVSSVSHEQLGA